MAAAAAEGVDGAAATVVEEIGPIGRHVGRLSYSKRMETRTDARASLRKSPVDMMGGLYSDSELVPKDGKRANTEVVVVAMAPIAAPWKTGKA